jgi:TRAP-type uncharacterized transport system substrate-binding protein
MANLDRPLAGTRRDPKSRGGIVRKAALVVGVLALVGLIVSRLDFSRSYGSLKNTGVASGAKEGNYAVIVDDLVKIAAKHNGSLRNVESTGSGDNIAKLAQASGGSCDVSFALAQDGSDFRLSNKIELLARLPKAESVFFLGLEADKMTELAQLANKKIGVGPPGSGAERLAHQLFDLPELKPLNAQLVSLSLADQLAAAKRGELDLALVVMDEDAPLVVTSVREMGLQIAGFTHIDVISRRLPHFRTGRIGAGQYEAVKVLPPVDKRVLRVETVVIGNHCASRSATIDMLNVLAQRFPDLVRFNKDTPNNTGLDFSVTAKGFFDHGGPELADEYVPWLVDLMAPQNWAYIVAGVSILFNAMGAGHRFRLWRIDDARVKIEHELGTLFGESVTLGDISRTTPQGKLPAVELRESVTAIIGELAELAARSRRQSLSVLVPMGQEMAYRYQEEIIYQTIAVLRDFVRRSEADGARSASSAEINPPSRHA